MNLELRKFYVAFLWYHVGKSRIENRLYKEILFFPSTGRKENDKFVITTTYNREPKPVPKKNYLKLKAS